MSTPLSGLELWMSLGPDQVEEQTWQRLRDEWRNGPGTWEDFQIRKMREGIRQAREYIKSLEQQVERQDQRWQLLQTSLDNIFSGY